MSWPDGGQEERTGEGRAGEGKGRERREVGGKERWTHIHTQNICRRVFFMALFVIVKD